MRGGRKILPVLFLLMLLWTWGESVLEAQPFPPTGVYVTSRINDNLLTWVHNSLNPTGYIANYQIWRRTPAGVAAPIALVAGNATTYADASAGYPNPPEYFYTIRAIGTDALVSDPSEEVFRFVPRVGLTRSGMETNTVTDLHYGSWDPYPGQWTDTYVRVLTTPNGGTAYGAGDYGQRQIVRATRSAAIPVGGPYYFQVRIGAPDWAGNPVNARYVSYSSSLPFYVLPEVPYEDNASSTYFNSSQRRVMAEPLAAGGVGAKMFANAGGNFWRYRVPVRLQSQVEYIRDPTIYISKTNAPCRVTVSVPAGQIPDTPPGRAAQEVRVADEYGEELPSWVASESTSGGWVTTFAVHFLTSHDYNEWDNYWIYWGNPDATQPAGFSSTARQTSQYECTPWYSRKLYRGGVEGYLTATANRLIASGALPADDEFALLEMRQGAGAGALFNWPFFDYATNTLFVSTNGYISFQPGSQPLNTWADFSGANSRRLIAPFWCNLMVNDTFPTNSGLYFRSYDQNTARRHHAQITWLANRFNAATEDYVFQANLFRAGDIALRYQTLNKNALGSPSGSGDNPININPHHTAGISANDGNWLILTDDSGSHQVAPLNDNTGRNLIHYFQSCYSWTPTAFSDPTNLCAGAGLTTVGHYDSRIFDGRSSDPTWGTLEYEITGNGAIDLYVRTSATSGGFAPWAVGHLLGSNLVAGTSVINLTLPNDRYLQYRLVFKKTDVADNPVLRNIRFSVGYIRIDSTTNPFNNTDVSQGQTFLASMTYSNLYSNTLDTSQASLTFTPVTASVSGQLLDPFPANIAPNDSATMAFRITVDPDSGNLDNWTYVNGFVEAGDGIATLTSTSVISNSWFRIRAKANLVIDWIETAFDKVNKGQGGIPVTVQLRNTSPQVPLVVNGASLTFTLGNYVWTPEIVINPLAQGLFAEYFNTDTNNPPTVATAPAVNRIDAQVNFNWVALAPVPEVTANYFMVRWSGWVTPEFAEAYTFYVFSDDGCRLWVNGELIINSWVTSTFERTGIVTLAAGVPAEIVLEYYERTGNARAELSWSSPSCPKEIIPAARLKPAHLPLLHGGQNRITTFTVAVLPDSPSGVAYLNGTASGTNAWVQGMVTDASGAAVIDSWVIQTPASMAIGLIKVPQLVYRGQANIPVEVEIVNLGEADLSVASIPLLFTLGSYTDIIPGEPMPVTVSGGESCYVKVLVSILEDTPTGTAWIDADAEGEDVNTGAPLSAAGAAEPGQWTILAEKILTFKDPSHLYPSTAFVRPDFGETGVFALAENLAPLKEYGIRWHDTANNEILSSTTIGFSDASGTLAAEWLVGPSADYGVYTVRITNPVDTYSPSQTSFRVVTSASVSAVLNLPAKVSVGQTFNGVMDLSNIGGAAASGMVPSPLTVTGPGVANLVSGPTPASVEVPGLGTASISYVYTAVAPGNFQISGDASGFDGSSDAPIQTETVDSNPCLIQTPALVTIEGLTATPTVVYRNQQAVEVLVTLRNSGEADASFDLADLRTPPNNTLAFGTSVLASPTLPAILPGNSVATWVFTVNINAAATLGMHSMTARVRYADVNNPSPIIIIDQTYSWEVRGATIGCSRVPTFASYQYVFNVGMTVYARGSGLPTQQDVFIRFYDHTDPPTDVGLAVATEYNTGDTGIVSNSGFLIPADSLTFGQWMVVVDDGSESVLGNILATQYFKVYGPGSYTINLAYDRETCFVGDTVNAWLNVANTATYPTNVRSNLNSFNHTYAPGSVGSLTRLSYPTQTVAFPSGASHTYVVPFQAVEDSGLSGSTTIRLPANSWRVLDDSNGGATIWYPTIVSATPPLTIFQKELDLASSVWDFGVVEPGNTSDELLSLLTNTGNHSLDQVRLIRADLRKSLTEVIAGSFLQTDPVTPFAVATASDQILRVTMQVPFHQPPGTYIATMAMYEDHNLSNTLEVAETSREPHDLVMAQVQVPAVAKAIVVENIIDFGVVAPGDTTPEKTIEFVGVGNLPLTDLRFDSMLATATIDPLIIGPLAYDGYGTASISVTAPAAPGLYSLTGTLRDNIVGGASSEFTVKFSVGTQSLDVVPGYFPLGEGTPTYLLPPYPGAIDNSGELPLSLLTGRSTEFLNQDQTGEIASDHAKLDAPSAINPLNSGPVSALVYIPGATATGTYLATFTWFEDLNDNGQRNVNEAYDTAVASLIAKGFYRITSLTPTEDFGGVVPDTTKTISVGIRNAGNLNLPLVGFLFSDLNSGADVFSAAGLWVTPPPLANFVFGDLQYVALNAQVPVAQPHGVYLGKMRVYGDLDLSGTFEVADEPYCDVNLRIEIGDQDLSISSPADITTNGTAASTTPWVFVTAQNTGSMALSRVRAIGTDLEADPAGPPPIASTAFQFSPSALVGSLVITQSRTFSTRISVPAGQPSGVYKGDLWTWEDANNDGIRQPEETSASIPVTLTVASVKALQTTPASVNLGIAARGDVATASLLVQNIGNSDLLEVRWHKVLMAGPTPIDPTALVFIPDPVGGITAPVVVGDPVNVVSTLTVTVPTGTADGVYNGTMIVYEDDFDVALDVYNPGQEPFANYSVQIQVVTPFIGVVPSPIGIPGSDPIGRTASVSFTVSNTGAIGFKNLRFGVSNLLKGADQINAGDIALLPTTFPALLPTQSQAGEVSVNVTPPTSRPPGVYSGTITFYDDRNNNGTRDAWEAFVNVPLSVTVNSYPRINVIPALVDAGKIARNTFATGINVSLQNTGNINLSGFSATLSELTHSTILVPPVPVIPVASLALTLATPEPILPGQMATAQIQIGSVLDKIALDQELGIYGDVSQIILLGGAVDSFLLRAEIIAGGPQGLGSGTIWQEIATITFPVAPAEKSYMLSAYVCPGTGTARIGFLCTDEGGVQQSLTGIEVDPLGNTTTFPVATPGRMTEAISQAHSVFGGTYSWFRVFVKYPFGFNAALASNTYVILQNASPLDQGNAVWFDGVQLEEAWPDQDAPGIWTEKSTLRSPSMILDQSGTAKYFEW